MANKVKNNGIRMFKTQNFIKTRMQQIYLMIYEQNFHEKKQKFGLSEPNKLFNSFQMLLKKFVRIFAFRSFLNLNIQIILLTKPYYIQIMVKVHVLDQIENPQECPICLDTIQTEAIIKICKHKFCHQCLVDWIQKQKHSCPVCREFFKTIHKKEQKGPTKSINRNEKRKKVKINGQTYHQINIKQLKKIPPKNQVIFVPYFYFIAIPVQMNESFSQPQISNYNSLPSGMGSGTNLQH